MSDSGTLNETPIPSLVTPELILQLRSLLWSGEADRKALEEGGISLTPSNFYSPIPSLMEIESSFEYSIGIKDSPPYYSESVFGGVDENRQFLESLVEYAGEFEPVLDGDENSVKEFYWNNSQFSFVDAISYYALIRHYKPNRVFEIGSGFSTLVAKKALEKNGTGSLVCIEPFPRPFLKELKDIELIESGIQDISVRKINDCIGDNDFLFIDSTHSLKTGSDCLYIYLVLLPEMRQKNLKVHVHDVFLPFGLPKNWLTEHHIYWTEQYLLLAFLRDNPRCKFLFGSAYHRWKNPELLKILMHERAAIRGASFWFDYNC
ncbi:MAG TPA: class I SAM-dependent methyltransferase [Oligoflexia bacterium]|nr:class I SAM-dependent methyltransferase [Oligoflexia bacterium]HMP49856.1 class I SAM-dependent methyltransferase [Oligoflexia bacterium]